MAVFRSTNPSTDEFIADYPDTTPKELDATLKSSHEAFGEWSRRTVLERTTHLRRLADELRRRRDDYAALMACEMGKPLAQGTAEVDKCAWVCEYYADRAEGFLKPHPVETDARASYVSYQPLGVILAIMPWNFPFWQVIRCMAPALAAGNTMMLKHSPNVGGCAEAIDRLVVEAGFPRFVFSNVYIDTTRVAGLISHPLVRGVSLTGSTRAGQAVGALAGQHLKKAVLELGGSDPYVILDDADLVAAADTCVQSRLINTGQSCIAAKRFIVTEKNVAAFEELVVHAMQKKTWGNPVDGLADLGPLARHDLRDHLHRQVVSTQSAGARLLLGGHPVPGPGAFYPPTVLTGVKKGMAAFDEETFGPVAAIVPAQDEAQAIELANDTPYGLGAAVFSKDPERAETIARQALDAGSCFVNAFVKSDPRLPFGGIKQSGLGRELSLFGLREFVNIKTVYVG